MPEDIVKGSGAAEAAAAMEAELHELRKAALELGRNLRSFGKTHVGLVGSEVGEVSDEIIREGRAVARDLEDRLGRVERTVERSVRDHPGAWIGGLLGVIGFGIAVGMILRQRD